MEQSFERNNDEAVLRIARFLDENKAGEVVALEIGTHRAWVFRIKSAFAETALTGIRRERAFFFFGEFPDQLQH